MAGIDSNTGTFGSSAWQTAFGTDAWVAQTFQASQSYDIASVKLQLRDYDSEPQGIITVGIRNVDGGKPTGADLVSGTYDGDDLTASWAAIEFTFSSSQALVSGTSYAIVIRRDVNGPLYYGTTSGDNYANGGRVLSHDAGVNWFTPSATIDLWFETYVPVPEKPITPGPTDTEANVEKTTSDLTWADGGNTDTFNIYFGTTSGDLTELETDIAVGSPTWVAPIVVLEINDYNPAAASGYRSPIIGDVLKTADNETTYTITDIKRGDLVNVQYEAKLYASRVGPSAFAGDVLDNDVAPDVNDPQAVAVTLNDSQFFDGVVETANYVYATRYYWRVDAVNDSGTTTGDEWYFDTKWSYLRERNSAYDPDSNWLYTAGSYQWADLYTAGGGRYGQQLVAIGHNSVYFGSL